MRKLALSALFVAVVQIAAIGQELPFELISKNIVDLEVEPGSPITAVFLLKNTTEEPIAIDFAVTLPENWMMVAGDESFEVDPSDTHIILSSFVAARATPAGPSKVRFTAKLSNDSGIQAEFETTYMVLERIDVDIFETDAFSYIIAGQELANEFQIHNASNTSVSLEIEAKSSERYPVEVTGFSGDILTLGVGETRLITIHAKSSVGIQKLLRHQTRVTAFIVDLDGTRLSQPPLRAESVSDILPRTTVGGNRFHRIPIMYSLLQTNEFGSAYDGGAKLDLSGVGYLDESSKHHIDFQLTKEIDFPPADFSHPGDLYRLIYTNSQLETLFGDGSFGLSKLTEEQQRGRGVSAILQLSDFVLKTYYHQSYWTDPVFHFVGGSLGYRLEDPLYTDGQRYRVDINALGAVENSLLFSINQLFYPIPALSLKLEAAGGGDADGEIDFAVTGGVSGSHGWIVYALESAYAGPKYPGAYNDIFTLNTNLDFRFFQRTLELEGMFNIRGENLSRSPDLPEAPMSLDSGLRSRYTIPRTATELTAGWNIASRRDLMSGLFDDVKNHIQFEAAQPLGVLRLNALLDLQVDRDRIYSETNANQIFGIGVSYSPTETQKYILSFAYDGLQRPESENLHGLNWETGAAVSIRNLKIDFGLQIRSELPTESSNMDIGLGLSYKMGDYGTLIASGEYGLNLRPSATTHSGTASLQYSGSFLLPVSRKSGIGAVTGTVRSVLDDQPIPNVVIRLGENAAVTDRRGKFLFPAVRPGSHYLDVDSTLAQIDLVPLISTPAELTVESQRDTSIEIPMGFLADIEGIVARYAFAEESAKFRTKRDEDDQLELLEPELREPDPGIRYEMAGAVAGVLIELKRDGRIQRRVSDVKGNFRFEDLAPGIWEIEIVPNTLDEYTYALSESKTVVLESGKDTFVRFDILPEVREIQIISGGEL